LTTGVGAGGGGGGSGLGDSILGVSTIGGSATFLILGFLAGLGVSSNSLISSTIGSFFSANFLARSSRPLFKFSNAFCLRSSLDTSNDIYIFSRYKKNKIYLLII
jgi:hypothetical protein